MSPSNISSLEYGQFCDFLENACGIVLGANKQYLVVSRLSRLLTEKGFGSLGELVTVLKNGRDAKLREKIIEAMTTNETSWFRDNHPFQSLTEVILPELASQRRNPLRIWSAACSSGQEPYSISMVVQEFQSSNPGKLASSVQIVATDISSEILNSASSACYDDLAIARGLSDERKRKYFRKENDTWKIDNSICSRVQFRTFNLMQSYAILGKFDVIFCRNVLIYFSTDSKRDILSRMSKALNPGGYLFLGGSESISGISDDFDMKRHRGGVIYKLKT